MDIGKKLLRNVNAKPLTDAEIESRGLEPFTFVGGPKDGASWPDSERLTRLARESAGRPFDRHDPTIGPTVVAPCGDGSPVRAVHKYRTDWDAKVYRYVGVEGFIEDEE